MFEGLKKTLSRRRILISLGLLGGAIGLPALLNWRWGQQDFVRPNYNPALHDAPAKRVSWMNWSGVQRSTPIDIYTPSSEQELADFIKKTKTPVRPIGSGHSSTGLGPTTGHIVSCNALTGLRSLNKSTGRARFGSGTLIFEAYEQLAEKDRGFANLPDIDVQSLAGAFSTGTHGTGLHQAALHDHVDGFKLVTARGEILNVSKKSHSELFDAGRVSMGALGIITEYTLKTIPKFKLHRRTIVEKIEDLLDRIEERSETHRNFEFFYLPGTGLGLAIIHDETDQPLSPPIESSDDDSLNSLKLLRDQFGWAPWLRRSITQANFRTGEIENRVGWSHDLLSTERPIRFNEMEYHLPREEGPKVIRQVIKMLDKRGDAFFPVEYRNTAPDSAWLSPFQGEAKASIAIHAAVDERYEYFYDDFEPIFLNSGGRPHWGKLHSLEFESLQSLYPDFSRFVELRKDLDPDGKFLNSHLRSIFGEAQSA